MYNVKGRATEQKKASKQPHVSVGKSKLSEGDLESYKDWDRAVLDY